MNSITEKHFLISLIVLLLPLSFGNPNVGPDAAVATSAGGTSPAQPANIATPSVRGFTANNVADGFGMIAISNMDQPREMFVSSIDPAATCARPNNVADNREINVDTDVCALSNDVAESIQITSIGLPRYESFGGSDASEYSRSSGGVAPISAGTGGGSGGGGANAPANRSEGAPISTAEPGSLVLLAFGLLALLVFYRWRELRMETRSEFKNR